MGVIDSLGKTPSCCPKDGDSFMLTDNQAQQVDGQDMSNDTWHPQIIPGSKPQFWTNWINKCEY